MTLRDVTSVLQELAPLELAEPWDNVGLLVGDEAARVQRVMTCLSLTPDVAREAIEWGAELIISHHPVLFRPVQRLTSETAEGAALLRLIAAGIAIYSPHTAFDSASQGINFELARRFGLQNIHPMKPSISQPQAGGGRYGELPAPVTLETFLTEVCKVLETSGIGFTGNCDKVVSKIAVACGAAGEYLSTAVELGCDVFVTGEARFHTCLEARSLEIALVLAGHFATERPAVVWLAQYLAHRFPNLQVMPSQVERDPINLHTV